MQLVKQYHHHSSEMDSKVALAEMVRESIVRTLKKQNVVVSERKSDSEIDSTVMRSFHFAVDLYDAREGQRMEQDLFIKLELTPEFFDNHTPLVFTALANRAKVGSCLAALVAYTTFMTHVCTHRVKAGFAIDDAYLNMLTSSVDHSDDILDWEELRKQLIPFRERSIGVGYDDYVNGRLIK